MPQRGIAYFPTGSPTYDYYGADRIGANLFGTSLVALDARTGKRLWHFQMVHHDLWDYDNSAAPQLTTIRHNGQDVDVVAQAGKTGFLYVFDRVTGEPIWPIEERPVPKSDVPGEQAWPTQPFPTAPPPFAQQTFTVDDVNPYILTPRGARRRGRSGSRNARNGGLFTPPASGRDGRDPRRARRRQLGHHGRASDQRHGLRAEHQRAVDLQADVSRRPGPGGGAGAAAAPGGPRCRGRGIYEQRCQSLSRAGSRGSRGRCRRSWRDRRGSAPTALRGRSSAAADWRCRRSRTFVRLRWMRSSRSWRAPGGARRGGGGRGAGPAPPRSPADRSWRRAARQARPRRSGAGGGVAGPPYPAGVDVPAVRYTRATA